MRVFLAAHGARLAAVRVEQHGGLLNPVAVFNLFDLPADFVIDRLFQEAERIEVLDLAPGAEFLLPDRSHRDVGIDPEAAFLHVPVTGADPGHQRMQRLGISHRFPGRTHVRLGHDFQQGRAGAVEVDAGHAVEVFMQRLAGIFFQVGTRDADGFLVKIAAAADLYRQFAAFDDRQRELADLVALGQIGIEVILAVETVDPVQPGANCESEADAAFHRPLVEHRQYAGQGDIDLAGLRVGRRAEGDGRAGEDFGLGGELGMHFQPDDGFPLHGVVPFCYP